MEWPNEFWLKLYRSAVKQALVQYRECYLRIAEVKDWVVFCGQKFQQQVAERSNDCGRQFDTIVVLNSTMIELPTTNVFDIRVLFHLEWTVWVVKILWVIFGASMFIRAMPETLLPRYQWWLGNLCDKLCSICWYVIDKYHEVMPLSLNHMNTRDSRWQNEEASPSNLEDFYAMSLTWNWYQVWSNFQWTLAIWLGTVVSGKNTTVTFHWKLRLDMDNSMENLCWLLKHINTSMS